MKFRRINFTLSTIQQWCKWMSPYVVLIIIIAAIRLLLIAPVQLPCHQQALVSLTYYGLRLPCEELWGYHRWGYRQPSHGDSIVFTCTDAQGQQLTLIGCCKALPGETIWIDPERRIIIPGRTSPDAQPICIPSSHRSIMVTPYNAHLLAYLMQNYEHCNTVRVNKFGQLELDGQPMKRVKLLRDYYWVEMPPDSFTIIPHDALVGKVFFTY
ncbi:MAG: S26 family signal peptidase [Prevotella sp.]|nr:S26 family signal peptidase [Prevotella sp.]MDY5666216.1 S26 family signal peptidase [Alloprevotella sp.]